jgi:hypothetical protein
MGDLELLQAQVIAQVSNLEISCAQNATCMQDEYAKLMKLVESLLTVLPRNSYAELQCLVEYMAQGSISPDVIRQMKYVLDTVAKTSVSVETVKQIVGEETAVELDKLHKRINSVSSTCSQTSMACKLLMSQQLLATTADFTEHMLTIRNIQDAHDRFLQDLLQLKANISDMQKKLALVSPSSGSWLVPILIYNNNKTANLFVRVIFR